MAPLALFGQEYPKVRIANGTLQAELYLPDAQNGYYRATRFDWSGVISSLKFKGHEYFGVWFPKHDPLSHDAITGPVEAFETSGAGLGYDEAKPGGNFVRIGVGLLEKPDEAAYRFTYTYKVVDPGKWKVGKGKDWIEFSQALPDKIGYGYVYTKRVRLTPGKPEMVLLHTLKNTGSKVIESTPYDHNFFVIDGQPSGPGFVLRFPFEPRAATDLRGLVELRGRELRILREFQGNENIFVALEGYQPTVAHHEIVVENLTTGAGVRITANKPLARLNFWTRRETVCPEPYIRLRIEPGQTETWETHYLFYTR
jgi:hypothetical protein